MVGHDHLPTAVRDVIEQLPPSGIFSRAVATRILELMDLRKEQIEVAEKNLDTEYEALLLRLDRRTKQDGTRGLL